MKTAKMSSLKVVVSAILISSAMSNMGVCGECYWNHYVITNVFPTGEVASFLCSPPDCIPDAGSSCKNIESYEPYVPSWWDHCYTSPTPTDVTCDCDTYFIVVKYYTATPVCNLVGNLCNGHCIDYQPELLEESTFYVDCFVDSCAPNAP
jgi:hypothetical protein